MKKIEKRKIKRNFIRQIFSNFSRFWHQAKNLKIDKQIKGFFPFFFVLLFVEVIKQLGNNFSSSLFYIHHTQLPPPPSNLKEQSRGLPGALLEGIIPSQHFLPKFASPAKTEFEKNNFLYDNYIGRGYYIQIP